MYVEPIPTDPSLPDSPDIAAWYPNYYCECPWPLRQERAERHGAARTYCSRCDREVPLKLGVSWH
jgi:hypothetical protein